MVALDAAAAARLPAGFIIDRRSENDCAGCQQAENEQNRIFHVFSCVRTLVAAAITGPR
jgi:hypothetical protein